MFVFCRFSFSWQCEKNACIYCNIVVSGMQLQNEKQNLKNCSLHLYRHTHADTHTSGETVCSHAVHLCGDFNIAWSILLTPFRSLIRALHRRVQWHLGSASTAARMKMEISHFLLNKKWSRNSLRNRNWIPNVKEIYNLMRQPRAEARMSKQNGKC